MRAGPKLFSALALSVAAWSGCSPTLDWREVRSEGDALSAWFPCKPERLTRKVELAGAMRSVQVLACVAGGSTWGLTTADVGEAARVEPALIELRAARSANLAGKERSSRAAAVPGMTAASGAVKLQVEGQRPDGDPLTEHALLFAMGTRVFHAAVLGGAPSTEALDTFFENLKPAR